MMAEASLVSVIVPTRNSADTLDRCLRSIRNQDHTLIELVVVDNASTDSTRAIAEKDCDVVAKHGPERSAQRNHGARIAKGSYLLFVDSDMYLETGVVRECIVAAAHTGRPAVIIPEVTLGDRFLSRCRALERSCYVGDETIEAARFFTREAFEKAGGYDESITGPEDWDLSVRVGAGKNLPHSDSVIFHDESHLRLRNHLAKKRYYAASSVRYWQKHRGLPLSQANLVFRPAYLRSWRKLMRHPVLTLGFITLKAMEAVAVTVGIVDSMARSPRRAAGATPRS